VKPLAVGRRVLLRAPTAADRSEFLALTRASRRFHRPWSRPPTTPASFAAWLRRYRHPAQVALLACRRDDARIVGVLMLMEIVRGAFQCAYLGYWVGAPFAGQGYMGEALRLALRHAFGPLRLHRVEANIQPGNAPSLALVRRAGFRHEGFSPRYLKIGGRWRDHERWALLVEQWRVDGARGSSPRPGRQSRPGPLPAAQ
jgi:[ribosomal protein S5]-alanine N-acetyltransferase